MTTEPPLHGNAAALAQVLDGEVAIASAGAPHRTRAGGAIIMRGGRPHAVKATKRFNMLLTMIRE